MSSKMLAARAMHALKLAADVVLAPQRNVGLGSNVLEFIWIIWKRAAPFCHGANVVGIRHRLLK